MRWRAAVPIALLATAALALAAGATAPPRGTIVFALDELPPGLGPARSVLKTVGTDGAGLRTLTDSGRTELEPVWSPDGRTLAFARLDSASLAGGSSIWTSAADGSHARRLTHDAGQGDVYPTWSADGRTIVYQGPGRRLWAVGATGGGARPLTPAPAAGLVDTAPSLSRDGKRLLFVRAASVAPSRSAIWVANADGSAARALTPMAERYWQAAPRLSPDGRTVAYVALADGQRPRLRLLAVDGSRDADTGLLGGSPAWSPDGKLLACLCDTGGGDLAVLAYDPRSRSVRRLLRIAGLHADSGGLDWSAR